MKNINILVICTGNSCRSQIAEGYLKYFSKQLNMNTNIYSAGIRAEGINKKAIEIMAKDGIDISNHTSNNLEEYKNTETINEQKMVNLNGVLIFITFIKI